MAPHALFSLSPALFSLELMTPFTSFQLPSGGVSRDPDTDEDAGSDACTHTHTHGQGFLFCRVVLPSIGVHTHEGVGCECVGVCAVCVVCTQMSV